MLKYKEPPFFSKLTLMVVCLMTSCSTATDRVFVQHDDIVESQQFIDNFKESNKIIKKYKSKKKSTTTVQKVETSVPKKQKTKIRKRVPASQNFMVKKDYSSEYRRYDDEYRKAYNLFEPIVEVGEEFVFALSYLGITAGHIRLKTQPFKEIDGQEVYHFRANLRSARFYSSFYKLDDSIDTFVGKESFKPLKYSLIQRESGQKVDDLQIFDHKNLKTHVFYERVKKGKDKIFTKVVDIPKSFQDSYSIIHFVRGLPLQVGDYYELPVITRGKIWILKVWVDQNEIIDIMDEDLPATRIRVETHFPGVLAKKGDIFFWFSDDEKKKLLRFDAKVKIGTISGELVEYRDGQ